MDYVCQSSSVFLLGTAKLSSAYVVCTPGRGRIGAGQKVQKFRILDRVGSKATTGVLCPLASSPRTLLALLWPLTSHVHQLGRHQSLVLLPKA